MSTTENKTGLHPMLWVAAASVTAVSLAGVAKLAGVLPDFSKSPAPESVATTPATPIKPIEAPPPIAAAEPTPAPAPAVEAKAEHNAPAPSKTAPPKPKPHPKPAQAAAGNPPPDDAVPAPRDAPPPGEHASRRVADAPPAPPPVCRDCGVIEHIEAIQQKGEGSGIGAIGGAILGGVLGHQVGEGSGKQIARIGGAVLGGLAGNEAERRYRTISHYQITVKLEDGTRRVIEQQSAPVWRVGDPVRVRNGQIVAGAEQPRRSADF